jgi:hypothetical protein
MLFMHTVFDLVGKFRCVTRLVPGSVPVISMKEIKLVEDISPSGAANGRTGWEKYLKDHNLIRQHIITEGLKRVWFEDWEFKPRKVKENTSQKEAA